MAVTTGNSGVVKVDVSGGTAAAVGEVRSFSIEETADTIETTSMGDTARTFTPSFTTGTVSIEALFDVDTVASNQAVFDVGTNVIFDVLPTGDATDEGYSGSGIVTSKSISVPYDGMVEASFSIQTSGTITAG
jgi:predicted secreted protein